MQDFHNVIGSVEIGAVVIFVFHNHFPSFYNDQCFFDHQEYYKTTSGEIIYVSHVYADINFLVKEETVVLNDFLNFMDSLNYVVSFLSPEFDWYSPNVTMAIIIRRKKDGEQNAKT